LEKKADAGKDYELVTEFEMELITLKKEIVIKAERDIKDFKVRQLGVKKKQQ